MFYVYISEHYISISHISVSGVWYKMQGILYGKIVNIFMFDLLPEIYD